MLMRLGIGLAHLYYGCDSIMYLMSMYFLKED